MNPIETKQKPAAAAACTHNLSNNQIELPRYILAIYILFVLLYWAGYSIISNLAYIIFHKIPPISELWNLLFFPLCRGAGRFSSSTRGMYQNDWINHITRFFSPKWYNDLSADAADFGMLENDGGKNYFFVCFLIKKSSRSQKKENLKIAPPIDREMARIPQATRSGYYTWRRGRYGVIYV